MNNILIMFKGFYLIGLVSGLVSYPVNLLVRNMSLAKTRDQMVIRAIKPKPDKNHLILRNLLLCSSLKRGEGYFNMCSGCHPIKEGSPHRFGPNLWNVVFRLIASCSNYVYSPTLIKLSNLKWTFNNLNKFIKQPSNFANGTYMTLSGIKNPIERMDILNYLNHNSCKPLLFTRFKFN